MSRKPTILFHSEGQRPAKIARELVNRFRDLQQGFTAEHFRDRTVIFLGNLRN